MEGTGNMSDPRHAWIDRWHRRNYRFNGEDVLSVTTIGKNMYSYNLERWKVKRAVDTSLRLATASMRTVHRQAEADAKGQRFASAAVISILQELDKPTQAATQGIGVHEALESWFTTGSLPATVDDAQAPFVEQAIKWAMEWNPRPLFLEPEVHALLGYAGSVDAIFEIDGEPVIVDYKTGGVFESAAMQLAAYQHADTLYPRTSDAPCPVVLGGECVCESLPMPSVERLAVLALKPDGYEMKWVAEGAARKAWLAFEGAMHIHHLKKERVLFVPATRTEAAA